MVGELVALEVLVGEPEELEALVGVEPVALVSEWELLVSGLEALVGGEPVALVGEWEVLVDWRRWLVVNLWRWLVNGRC